MSDTVSIAGGNLFMRCDTVNQNAFREPPAGIHFRSCRPDELELWKRLSVEDPTYVSFMTEYFEKVYASQAEEFFRRCTFACTQDDTPIGTCFLWKAYGNRIYISLMNQFTPMPGAQEFPELQNPLEQRQYEAMVAYLQSLGMENVFIQEGGTVGESFIPSFDGEGIIR